MALRWVRFLIVQAAASWGPLDGQRSITLDLHRVEPEVDTQNPGHRDASSSLDVTPSGRRLQNSIHACDLANFHNVQYAVHIQVGDECEGSGRQIFSVVPDTGSSELWILAENCTRCGRGHQGSKFAVNRSCSARSLGHRYRFAYGDGTSVDGFSIMERIQLGDIQVKNQFLVGVDTMETKTQLHFDGILGLAHESHDRPRTVIATLFREHPDLPKQFSFFVTWSAENSAKLVLGDPDIAQFSSDSEFLYGSSHFTLEQNFWLTSVWSIGWMGTGVEAALPQRGTFGSPAMIDSGTSVIVLETYTYDILITELRWRLNNCREMHKTHLLKCDCPPSHDLSSLPPLVINVVNNETEKFGLCMYPEEYILTQLDDDGGVKCVPAFKRGDKTIFGMLFIRSFYTNFDIANHRIGFARNKLSPRPTGSVCSMAVPPLLRLGVWALAGLVASCSMLFLGYLLSSPYLRATDATLDVQASGTCPGKGYTPMPTQSIEFAFSPPAGAEERILMESK